MFYWCRGQFHQSPVCEAEGWLLQILLHNWTNVVKKMCQRPLGGEDSVKLAFMVELLSRNHCWGIKTISKGSRGKRRIVEKRQWYGCIKSITGFSFLFFLLPEMTHRWWERERERERERESKTAEMPTHWGDGMVLLWNLSAFLLRSLLLQEWYRATSRHRIVLVSPRFFTFSRFIHLRFFSSSYSWEVWRKARFQSHVTLSFTVSFFFWSPFVSAGYVIFRTPTQILVVRSPTYKFRMDTPLSSMPSMKFTWHFIWGSTAFCLLKETRVLLDMLPTQFMRHFKGIFQSHKDWTIEQWNKVG